jgi:hypothetical protein
MKKKTSASKPMKKMGMGGSNETTPKSSYSRFVGPSEPKTQPTAKQQADMKKIETPPTMKKGGSVGKTAKTSAQKKFASLAPPKNKITFADKIAGSKKKK